MNQPTDIVYFEIPEVGKKASMPLSLERMDERQYMAFFELMYKMETGQLTYYDFAPLAVYALLDMKEGKRKISEEELEESFSNISMLAEYISELFEKTKNVLRLKLAYTKNHIEHVNIPWGKKYYGPKQYFEDVGFGEYEDGLNIFLQYSETPSRELLEQLMATFYRPKYRKTRKPYLELEVKTEALKFSKIPIGILFGFYYNFAAFHTYFSSSQVYYSGQIIDFSILFSSQPEDKDINYESPYPSLGIKSTGIEIAKTGVLGNLEQVRNSRLWDVAFLLYDSRKKDLDEKAITERQKKNEK